MNKNTPAKHKTPNYRLKTYHLKDGTTYSQWEALPLRAGRKDW